MKPSSVLNSLLTISGISLISFGLGSLTVSVMDAYHEVHRNRMNAWLSLSQSNALPSAHTETQIVRFEPPTNLLTPTIDPYTNSLLPTPPPAFTFDPRQQTLDDVQDWYVIVIDPTTGQVMHVLRDLPTGRLIIADIDQNGGSTNMPEYVTVREFRSTNVQAAVKPLTVQPLVVLRREVVTNRIAAHTERSPPVKEVWEGLEFWIQHADTLLVPAQNEVVTNWVIGLLVDGRPIELQTLVQK